VSGARGRGRERDGARNKSARGHFGLSEPAISRGRAGKGESICASAGRAGGRALRPAHTGCASPASPPARRPPASGPRADRADGATRRSTWDKGGWGIEGSLSHRRCRAARWGKGGRGRGSGGQTDVHFPQPRGAGGTRCREPRRTRRARIPPRPSICAFPSLVTRAPGLAPAVWTHEELLPQAHLVEGLDDLSVVGHNDAICADLDAIRRRGCCEKGGRERARRGVKNALHLHKTGPQQRAPPLIHAPAAGADSLMMTESGERGGRVGELGELGEERLCCSSAQFYKIRRQSFLPRSVLPPTPRFIPGRCRSAPSIRTILRWGVRARSASRPAVVFPPLPPPQTKITWR
jgi:hypothetical protein